MVGIFQTVAVAAGVLCVVLAVPAPFPPSGPQPPHQVTHARPKPSPWSDEDDDDKQPSLPDTTSTPESQERVGNAAAASETISTSESEELASGNDTTPAAAAIAAAGKANKSHLPMIFPFNHDYPKQECAKRLDRIKCFFNRGCETCVKAGEAPREVGEGEDFPGPQMPLGGHGHAGVGNRRPEYCADRGDRIKCFFGIGCYSCTKDSDLPDLPREFATPQQINAPN